MQNCKKDGRIGKAIFLIDIAAVFEKQFNDGREIEKNGNVEGVPL
jgi:hypothetical protein